MQNDSTNDISSPPDDNANLRKSVYALLIAIAAGGMIGRILSVNAVDNIRLEQYLRGEKQVKERTEMRRVQWTKSGRQFTDDVLAEAVRVELNKQRPFLSGNDRSRWMTMRALVEHGTYAIDEIVAEPNWDTIDMVKHKDSAGDWHLYSSKPPLLATLYAGLYWVVHQVTGKTLGTHPFEIGRFMLIVLQVVPMIGYFWLLSRMLERYGRTDWGRLFVMAAACFATFLTTYVVVLNNHLPGAISALATVYFATRIWYDGDLCKLKFFLAGLSAAFVVTCELPALSLLGLVGAGLLWKHPKKTLMFGVPGVLLVMVPFFATNYIAHQSWRMPYAHRSDGAKLFSLEVDGTSELEAKQLPEKVRQAFSDNGIELSTNVKIRTKNEDNDRRDPRRWVIEDYGFDTNNTDPVSLYSIKSNDKEFPPVSMTVLPVHAWDDWYDYDYIRALDGAKIDSYWRNPKGIDKGEPRASDYVLHALVGHHGIFSLTPIWLLAIPGLWMLARSPQYRMPALASLIALLTIVCLAFYLSRPQIDRNYGGTANGFRWVFWFTPLWLLAMLPAADWSAATRLRRGVVCILLTLSVLSVAYPTWNPWTFPWLMNLYTYWGGKSF